MEDKDQLRVLLAFALSALVLLFFAPKSLRKPDAAKSAQTQPAVPAAGAPASGAAQAPAGNPPRPAAAPGASGTKSAPGTSAAAAAAATPPAAATAAPVVSATAETETVVSSDLYEVHLSNHGGVAVNYILKGFKDGNNKPLDLVNPLDVAHTGYPFSIYSDDPEVRNAVTGGLYVATATSTTAPATVSFDYSNGSIHAHKEFRFEPTTYIINVTTEVTRDGKPVAHQVAWRGGFGDRTVPKYNLTTQVDLSLADKQDRKALKDVKTDTHITGPFTYVTIEDLFFVAAFMPAGDGATDGTTPLIPGAGLFKNSYIASVGDPLDLMGVSVGGDGKNQFRVYVGPKDYSILKTIAPDPRNEDRLRKGENVPSLASVIDFGWFAVVAIPMFMALKWIFAHWVANYGWSIVILTVGINFVLFPLKLSSMKSAMKMQRLAPQVKQIQDRYKKYKMNDPKKAEANEEIMALYKKEGVNPLGGCLPMAIQLPFLYGFYRVLSQSVEMRHAPWMWVPDLSRPEPFFIHMLPILFLVSMVVLQKMTPQAPGGDPVQQKMMMLMPIMMGVMFYNVSSGLLLYWLSSNIVQLGQQWYINKTAPPANAISKVEK